MDNPPLESRASAIIEPGADGSFQHVEIPADEPIPRGMFEALLLPCRDAQDSIIDIVAWEMGHEAPWWRLRRFADVLGYAALADSRWGEIRLYSTPRRWLAAAAPNAVCVLDWRAPLEIIFARVHCPIICESRELSAQFATALALNSLRDLVRA